MEWPWEIARRHRDESRLADALVVTDMAQSGHISVVPALVASFLQRPFQPRPLFPDAETALDAIWDEALSLPRWQHALTTRENARERLNESRRASRMSWSDRRYFAGLVKKWEQDGDHQSAAALRGLLDRHRRA